QVLKLDEAYLWHCVRRIFAFWSGTRQLHSPRIVIWSALLMTLSVVCFIGFEVFQTAILSYLAFRFSGGMDGVAYALDAQTGKLLWKQELGAKVTTSAAVCGTDLYLGTAKRHLYRLNTDTGKIESDLATKATPNRHLVIDDDSLLAFLGDEILASFDPDLTKLRWSVEASKEWTSARPYPWKDVVLAGNRRELIAFRSSDGTRVWLHQFPETVRGIGTSPGVLYAGTLKGPVFGYGSHSPFV